MFAEQKEVVWLSVLQNPWRRSEHWKGNDKPVRAEGHLRPQHLFFYCDLQEDMAHSASGERPAISTLLSVMDFSSAVDQ